MFSYSYSAAVHGLDICMVNVEADVSDGLPLFNLVGFLGSEVKEARDRVRISIKNSGYIIPTKRITVNLSPADIRKEGTAFDLPIAISVLSAFGYLPQDCLKNTLMVGELGLDGHIKPVSGVLPMVCAAKEHGFGRFLVPKANVKEAAAVLGIDVIGIENLREAVMYLNGEITKRVSKINMERLLEAQRVSDPRDFCDVCGQPLLKRALEVAAAGLHNVLMIGPPGSGKTMLAERLPGILPPLCSREEMEISKVYSIKGLLDDKTPFILSRPFRAPHHTITPTAFTGGGSVPEPGELSLAYGGVLFLDELSEFQRGTLELLRQPLEERKITISRLNGSCRYPADFMLVAAMNPCGCGYFPDAARCRCTPWQVQRYLGKISRPLLDRIDICAEAVEVNFESIKGENKREESSEEIRKRVMGAREIQMDRYRGEEFSWNSQLSPGNMDTYCELGREEKEFLEEMFHKMQLSVRGYHRVLKVARTAADLAGESRIGTAHLSEAVCYRGMDQKYWRYQNDK